MKKLIAFSVAAIVLLALCTLPAAAERVEIGGYYEYPAEKTDEILAGEAGEVSTFWTVPFNIITPALDGVINPNEYARLENLEDYLTFAATTSLGADKADALYQKVKDGIFDAYWCWDDRYLYLAFDVDCVDGYNCTPEQDVLLFTYNCLQVGLADVDAEGKDHSYTELGFGYDAVQDRNITFTWNGTYLSKSDDFAGSYNADTQRVTYELRIDLQQALDRDRYPENGDQCNFAFVLEVAGQENTNENAQVMFCHGMAGQYSTKRTEYFARITFAGRPDNVVIDPGIIPPYINPGEIQYELREVMDFSFSDVFATMIGEGASLEQVTEGEDIFMRITALEDGCYVYSTLYPRNLLSDARYLVIKYRTSSPEAERCGIIWKTRQNPVYDLELCYTDYLYVNGEWNYLLVDTSGEPNWSDYILNLGIVPFYGAENAAGAALDVAWIKAYNLDPYELYAPLFETVPDTSGQGEPTFAPDTTEPYYEETVVETGGETFYEQEVPENNLGGLFFEVFGDDALPGCQGQPLGCKSGGSKSGGCHAVAGGLLAFCLLAAGLVFRKKE